MKYPCMGNPHIGVRYIGDFYAGGFLYREPLVSYVGDTHIGDSLYGGTPIYRRTHCLHARGRGYIVVAVSGTGYNRCWDLQHDVGRVTAAIEHVKEVERLHSVATLWKTLRLSDLEHLAV